MAKQKFYQGLEIRSAEPIDERFYINSLTVEELQRVFGNDGRYGFAKAFVFDRSINSFQYLLNFEAKTDVIEIANWKAIQSSGSFNEWDDTVTYKIGNSIYFTNSEDTLGFYIALDDLEANQNPEDFPELWLLVGGATFEGTAFRLPRFNSEGNQLEDSSITDDGSLILIDNPVEIDSNESNKSGLKLKNIKNDNYNEEKGSVSLFAEQEFIGSICIGWDNNIYVTNLSTNSVIRISPDGTKTTYGSTGEYPHYIFFHVNYDIWVSNLNDNTVTKLDYYGGVFTYPTGNGPQEIVGGFVSGETVVYIPNFNDNTVSKITSSGVSTILGTTGNGPKYICIDNPGNVYVVNTGDNTVSKITPAGVSTILGTTGNGPSSIEIDSNDNIYVTNSDDATVTKITPAGVSTIFATTEETPLDISINTNFSLNEVFVCNFDNDTVTKITQSGETFEYAMTGNKPNILIHDKFNHSILYVVNSGADTIMKIVPQLIDKRLLTVDQNGNVVKNDEVVISKINGMHAEPDGSLELPISGNPYKIARFSTISPTGIENSSISDLNDNVLIEKPVEIDSLENDTSGLKFLNLKNNFVLGESHNFASTGANPWYLAIDSIGNIYSSNYNDNNITKITPDGTSSIFATTDDTPRSMIFDKNDNLYVCNYGANNVLKITPDGTSSIFATTDSLPLDIAIDSNGNLYTCNIGANNITKISPIGESSVFATLGVNIRGLSIDSTNHLYTINNSTAEIIKITPGGTSSVFASVGNGATNIIVDKNDNLYTSNSYVNSVSKITPDGTSVIFASTGTIPLLMVIDPISNDLYVTNSDSDNITKITSDGTTTIFGQTGSNPRGIVMDSNGDLFVCNFGDNNVTKVLLPSKKMLTLDADGNVVKNDEIVVTSINKKKPRPDGNVDLEIDVKGKGKSLVRYNNTGDKYVESELREENDYVFANKPIEIDSHLNGISGLKFSRMKNIPNRTNSVFATFAGNNIVQDWMGNTYALPYNGTELKKITPAGVMTNFKTIAQYSGNLVYQSSTNNMYFTNGSVIYKLTLAGVLTTFTTLATSVHQLVIDSNGDLLALSNSSGTIVIYKIIEATGSSSTFATLGTWLNETYLACDQAGNTFVLTHKVGLTMQNVILKITNSGSVSTFTDSLPFGCDGMHIWDNNIYVSINIGSNDTQIVKVNLSTAIITDYTIIEDGGSNVMVHDATYLYVLGGSAGNITRVSPSGVNEIWATGLFLPNYMLYTASGELMVSDNDTNIYKIIFAPYVQKLLTIDIDGNVIFTDDYLPVTNNTTTALSAATLDATYPEATIGFRVHCISISPTKYIYEKTSTGWIQYEVNIVS